MQKWEYLDLPVEDRKCDGSCLPGYDDNGQLILNSIGQDGWELVTVDNGVAYFKRPIFDPNDLPVGVHYAGDITDKIEFGVEYKDESP